MSYSFCKTEKLYWIHITSAKGAAVDRFEWIDSLDLA
jgi:hypothetical protein